MTTNANPLSPLSPPKPRGFYQTLSNALIITRREVRDSFRDWRIIAPIVFLTFAFPFISQYFALWFQDYLNSFEADVSLIGVRSAPFFLMVVGFFPISISLVIALETFVGEKERRSLEPLLSTPLSSTELYIGKTLSAMIPPLFASLFGMSFYLILSLLGDSTWRPEPMLLIQIFILTIVQALVMVTGAVVVSSQTTSTRAANLLASFIILPMSFVVIGESALIFTAPDAESPNGVFSLWIIIVAMMIVAVLFLRVGNSIFNREILLSSTLDELNLRGWVAKLWRYTIAVDLEGTPAKNLSEFYRRSIPHGLWQIRTQIMLVTIIFILATGAGVHLSNVYRFPIPPESELMTVEETTQGRAMLVQAADENTITFNFILSQNLRVIGFAFLLGIFSFGVLPVLMLSVTFGVLGYIAGFVLGAGYSPMFLIVSILPHGIIELPMIVLAGALAFAIGACISRPLAGKTVGHTWMVYMGISLRLYLGLILPGFIIAAAIESTLTLNLFLRYLGA
jgi:uncharacterized membrane protein SpoIIM required for sporulation/ABC-type transport system involved in multi-copper enzyme maturation permease subunit